MRTERLAAVGELAASVGHELRNPLAAVRNATTYISRRLGVQAPPALEPRVAQFFGVIDRELTACSRIISDLLDFARERPMQLEACPLRPLVEEVTSLFPGAPCRLDNLVSDGLPAPYLDRDQFRQVLVNLVQNAIEAVPAEGGVVAVEVNVAESGDFEVRVRDNGCGIPADIAAKIFEPLFTTKTKGTGLGLAIVANMVRRHRGQIRVESEPGRGTTFVIQLPPAEAKAA